MKRRRFRRTACILAALTTGVCAAFGLGCIPEILASIGATFY